MNTQNKIRNIATKIMAMLMSAICLAVSVNVPVLAAIEGPITGGEHVGDVAVTAGHFSNDNMAGVYATNENISVGNDLSVTSNTDPNVTDHNVTGVYATGESVSVGNDLSVASERNYTKGIYAAPNANEAVVTIGNNLTVHSNYANTDGSTMGIEARPAAGATADITIGNPETNEGNVTVTGTDEAKGINIAGNGSTYITVRGDVTSNEGSSAKGVYLGSLGGAITNVNIGGAVNANGTTNAMGLDIRPSGNNRNEIYVGKGISASAAEATGVYVDATNTSNTTINVKGNIVVSSEAAEARGIYADGGDRTNLKIQVKGDVTSNGAGIYTKDMSLAQSTDIIIDGTVKSTADGTPAVILDDSSINNGQVSITAWKIESNGTALFGKDDGAEIQPNVNSQNAVAGHISYIIRVTQPEIDNTHANVLRLAKADGTAWDNKKAWSNGADVAPTMLNVAGENQKVYVKIDVPAGYQLAGVYADSARTVALTQDENGSYYLIVPRGGGIDVNVAFTLIQVDPDPSVAGHYESEPAATAPASSIITAARIQSMILSQLSAMQALGQAVTVIDLYLGNEPNLSTDAVLALFDGNVAKRCHFSHNGQNFVLFVPVTDTRSAAFAQCLTILNAEPGGLAGPLRISQIFAPVGTTALQE